jgi:hypothetical protein
MSSRPPSPLLDLLVAFFLEEGGSAELSDAAVRALEAGLDSPSLRIVAGLSGWTSPWELESLLGRVLRELELPMPARTALVRAAARPAARAFLQGQLAPEAFVEKLYALSKKDRHRDEHHPWCQLHDDWTLACEGTWGIVAEATALLRDVASRLVTEE